MRDCKVGLKRVRIYYRSVEPFSAEKGIDGEGLLSVDTGSEDRISPRWKAGKLDVQEDVKTVNIP